MILPDLARRPLSLKRYPDTVEGEAFWEKTLRASRRSGSSECLSRENINRVPSTTSASRT